MRNTTRYIYLMLEERNGEYEYYHRSVHQIPDGRNTTATKIAKSYIEDFYGGIPKKEDGGYYFHGGEVFVRVDSWQFISEDEYNVLKQYL